MPLGLDISKWKNDIARGHTTTWIASAITIWAIAVVLFTWWLVANENKATKFILAGILLYEILP